MDKKEAVKRLDALESEARELRKIIEAPEEPKRLVYDWRKVYVAVSPASEMPYLLAGKSEDQYLRWHLFRNTEQGWAPASKTGQEALDSVQGQFEVREFDDPRAGIDYFYALYCKRYPRTSAEEE